MVKPLTIVEHEEIFVSKERNIAEKIISEKDKKELFSIEHTDRFNKKTYVFSRKGNNGIKANSIVGSISLKSGLIIEILPKFAKDDLTDETIIKYRKNLLHMIQVSNERNFISSTIQSSKISVGEMPLIRYMIELFSESLLHSLRNGIVTTYNKTVENSSYIRGNILVTKTIQNNLIDKSKVYISYNKHSANNLLMQVFKTLAQLLLNDTNLSYRAKQYFYEAYTLLDNVKTIPLKQYHFDKVIFNRLNEKYETLFRQAEFIFNQYMPFTSNINSTPFWAILFDMNHLFEKFCAFLFRKSNIDIEEQSIVNCFQSGNKMISAKPDFIIKSQVDLFNTENIIVIDAKWKLLRKKLYGLNAQDFWQLFSYMNLINHSEEIDGYFIVPKNSDEFDDEIVFEPMIEGKKSITILSINFSLEFEEILERYQFKLENGCLKLNFKEKKEQKAVAEVIEEKKAETVLEDIVPITIEESGFDFEQFIYELMLLNTLGKKRNKIHHNKEDKRFENLFYLKKKQRMNEGAFKVLRDNNIAISELSWHLENLDIKEVPENIKYLKKLKYLKIINKNLTLTKSLLELNNLRNLVVNKSIVLNNIKILKELKEKGIKIEDNEGNQLIEDISSIKEPKPIEKEIKKEVLETIKSTKKTLLVTSENYSTLTKDEKQEANTNEYYDLAVASFKNKAFEDALEFLKEYKVSSKKREILENNIYKEIGQPFNSVKKELLAIKEKFDKENRTDIKKSIKDLKLEDYYILNFLTTKLSTQEINHLTFILTYLDTVDNIDDKFIKTINDFFEIVNNNLINISEEQNKTLNSNVLAWKDLETGLIWEMKNNYNTNQVLSWKKCFDYAKKLNLDNYANYNDWRVPTIEELKTLHIDNINNNFYIKKPLSTNITKDIYWSATEYKVDRKSNAYIIKFKSIKDHENQSYITHSFSIRCVRGK